MHAIVDDLIDSKSDFIATAMDETWRACETKLEKASPDAVSYLDWDLTS